MNFPQIQMQNINNNNTSSNICANAHDNCIIGRKGNCELKKDTVAFCGKSNSEKFSSSVPCFVNSPIKMSQFAPQSGSSVDKSKYEEKIKELLKIRFPGYSDEDIDTAMKNMDKGKFAGYGIDEIEYQGIKNSAFLALFEENNLLEIGERK